MPRYASHDSARATRAMPGEEMWVAKHPMDKALAVNVEAALLLVYWRLVVEYYEGHRNTDG